MINFPQRNWTDYGGEVTPDLVVRSHALVFAFTPVIIELFYNVPPNHF